MYWLAPEKDYINILICLDKCQTNFGTNETRIFAYPGDDQLRCACRLCPEDYMVGNKLNLLLDLMGCRDVSSMKSEMNDHFRPLLTYYCKPEGPIYFKFYRNSRTVFRDQ